MSYARKIQFLILIYHLLFIVGLYFIDLPLLFVGLLSYVFFGKFGGEIGLHRYFSHRSFITSNLWDKALLICATFTGLGSPISWAATHRLHHQFSDRPGDPHSPNIQNPVKVWLTLWEPFTISKRVVSDLTKEPYQRFIHKNYIVIHLVSAALLATIDPKLPCFILAWPCVISFHLAGAVNVLCHLPGLKNHQALNFFGLGDALHKNHHSHPSLPSNQVQGSCGFDISGWFIKSILAK